MCWNDDGSIHPDDYIFVYTLLLHFCCVKYPETKFHDFCRKLPDQSQQNIAIFFKELQRSERCSRESLRQGLAELIGLRFSSPPHTTENILTTSGTSNTSSGNSSSINFNACHSSRVESPIKTPRRQNCTQRTSPLTPKSHLLEERTRELFHLRVSSSREL